MVDPASAQVGNAAGTKSEQLFDLVDDAGVGDGEHHLVLVEEPSEDSTSSGGNVRCCLPAGWTVERPCPPGRQRSRPALLDLGIGQARPCPDITFT